MKCPEPENTHDFGDIQVEELDIYDKKLMQEEVYCVIRKMKSGKAPEIDGIQAELLDWTDWEDNKIV